jgi:hypothetical protein
MEVFALRRTKDACAVIRLFIYWFLGELLKERKRFDLVWTCGIESFGKHDCCSFQLCIGVDREPLLHLSIQEWVLVVRTPAVIIGSYSEG